MERDYSIAEAKDQLSSLVRAVEQGGTVRLTRRGKPVAVLLSARRFERLQGGKRKIEWGEPFLNTGDWKFDRDEANAR